ncbi:MAG: NnrS family protein [Bdellovibrionaceae bacterium]|nr:NnrS family protein [Bdellovibrionales bacterium]MCB9085065.1 NnrS family protein [Pseudobdellovibrionaceae bacterium]
MRTIRQTWNFDSPIWALGFRPFFLLGGASAVLLMALWVGFQTGYLQATPYFPAAVWHPHEMVYGFCMGIIAGFILTATQNWAGIPGVSKGRLFLLVMLWLAGRLGLHIWSSPNPVYATVDLAFIPCLGWFLWPYLSKPDQKRNRIFYFFFALLFFGNLLIHLDVLGWTSQTLPTGIRLGLNGVLLIIILIGGRVLPFFTGKALPNAKVKTSPVLEKIVVPATCLFALADGIFVGQSWLWPFALVMFALHGLRWWWWGPLQTKPKPILWILFVGYLFIVLGFLLQALAHLSWIMPTLAVHTTTVGGFGILILGMISRVSLGHTGRPIHASPGIVLAYVLLILATLLRVAWPLINSAHYPLAVTSSGILWILSFLIFVSYYLPILWQPRIDGRPG